MRLKITKHPELDFPALFSSLHSNTNRAVHLDLHWSIDLRKPLISTFLIWCSFNLSGDVDAIHTSRDLLLFFPSIFVRFINMYKPYQEKNANSAPIFLINQLDHGKQLLCIFFLQILQIVARTTSVQFIQINVPNNACDTICACHNKGDCSQCESSLKKSHQYSYCSHAK